MYVIFSHQPPWCRPVKILKKARRAKRKQSEHRLITNMPRAPTNPLNNEWMMGDIDVTFNPPTVKGAIHNFALGDVRTILLKDLVIAPGKFSINLPSGDRAKGSMKVTWESIKANAGAEELFKCHDVTVKKMSMFDGFTIHPLVKPATEYCPEHVVFKFYYGPQATYPMTCYNLTDAKDLLPGSKIHVLLRLKGVTTMNKVGGFDFLVEKLHFDSPPNPDAFPEYDVDYFAQAIEEHMNK